jgi:hypothetical protein
MLKDIIRGEIETQTSYELVYDDGHGNGFGFPCNASGSVINLPPEAVANLAWCSEHPEKFIRAGEVVERRWNWRNPDRGACSCGETVTLENQYYGACQCPKCGQWYNLFGEELLPPDQWDMDLNEEDY